MPWITPIVPTLTLPQSPGLYACVYFMDFVSAFFCLRTCVALNNNSKNLDLSLLSCWVIGTKPHKSAYVLGALSLSALSSTYTATSFDPNPSLRSVFPAYIFLILHAIAALIYQRYLEALTVGVRSHFSPKAMAFAAAGSMSFLAALFTQIMVCPRLFRRCIFQADAKFLCFSQIRPHRCCL
jgi:hypothetical protein